MHLNLQDPDSIIAWWCEYPERHWDYLEAFARSSPEFGAAIGQARHRIETDPRLQSILVEAVGSTARPPRRGRPAGRAPATDALDTLIDDFAPRYGALPH